MGDSNSLTQSARHSIDCGGLTDWLGWARLLVELNLTKANLQDKDENVRCWLPGERELIGPLPTRIRVSASRSGVPGDGT